MSDIKVFTRDKYSLLKSIEKQIPHGFGCTYVLEYGEFAKIGCTSKPYKRVMALKIAAENYGNCELGRIAILPCCKNFGVVEGFLHEKFSECRKKNTELFNAKFETVLENIENFNINYRSKIEIVEVVKEEKKPEAQERRGIEFYLQRRLGELERRLEKVEAQLEALKVNPSNDGETYTVTEFARAMGVCNLTIRRRLDSGEIKGWKSGRTWRIPKSELIRIFE